MKGTEYPADRPQRWTWPVTAGALGLLAYLVARWSAGAPGAIERFYATGIWPVLSRPLSLVTGFLPFAVGEALVFGTSVITVALALRALRDVLTRRRRRRNAVAGTVRFLVGATGLAVFLFYLLWGLNYSRPPFEERAGWPEWVAADAAELVALSESVVALSNQAYLDLHGSADIGEPTRAPEDMRALESALDQGWVAATRRLDLEPAAAARFGRVKRPFSSELIARLGITGMYFPFTGEANVLRGIPAMRLPHAMSHEKAHQRGITGEADASFLGFTASALSPHPLARYAAAMFAQTQLLNSLAAADPDEWVRVGQMRLPGPKRDNADLAAYINRFNGVADRVATAVNDRYLRANRVPGGVHNYGRSVRLVIEYARLNGGRVLPAADATVGTERAASQME